MNIIHAFDKVVIAAVNGLALGSGCDWALACDMRVADKTTLFGFPEVGLGPYQEPGVHSVWQDLWKQERQRRCF